MALDDLRRSLTVGWGTLYHHVDKLVAEERIVLVKVGKTCLVFTHHQQPAPEETQALALLRTSTCRAIARDISSHPGTSVRDVAERTGCRPRTIYYQVRQLLDAGLLRSTSQSRHFGLRATPLLERTLEGTRE